MTDFHNMRTKSILHRLLTGLVLLVAYVCFQPAAQAQAPADITCSGEGERCWFPGTADVSYGAGTRWVTKTLRGGFNCGLNTFGSDPAPGTLKTCKIVSPVCAVEGKPCDFKGTRTVKYGARGTFATKTFKDGVICGVAAFGRDPVPNVLKQCYLSAPDEKPLNEVTLLGSHNGISSVAYGYIIQQSQRDTVTAQIEYGVRALEIDIVHDTPPGYEEGVYVCHCGEAPHSISAEERLRIAPKTGITWQLAGWTHGSPYMRFSKVLQELDAWLVANPDEILVVMIQNNSANWKQFDDEVDSARLRTKVYPKKDAAPWLKRSEMVRSNQRLVLLIGQDDNHKLDAKQSKYATDMDTNHVWGGNLEPPSSNTYPKSDVNFSRDANKMIPVGSFHTSTPNELVARGYNEYSFLSARRAEWERKGVTRMPSILQVNHPHIGDPLRFVNDLNGVDYLVSSRKDTVGPAGDTWQIRFENNAVALNTGLEVFYFEDMVVGGVATPMVKMLSTGAVNNLTPVRMINIPKNTSKGMPITVSVKLYSTSTFELFKETLPAGFTGSPVPCFKASGVLTSPKGGRCE